MIYTIGYQGRSLAAVMRFMEELKIDKLVDVRSNPYSRPLPELNRNRLIPLLGDRYVWLGDILGGKGPRIQDKALRDLAAMPGNLLVMCMEADPCQCHRFYDIGCRLARMGVEVTHIWSAATRTHAEMEEECNGKKAG